MVSPEIVEGCNVEVHVCLVLDFDCCRALEENVELQNSNCIDTLVDDYNEPLGLFI
jgi:hypothetical protein